jgi:cysteine-rich repeat protein
MPHATFRSEVQRTIRGAVRWRRLATLLVALATACGTIDGRDLGPGSSDDAGADNGPGVLGGSGGRGAKGGKGGGTSQAGRSAGGDGADSSGANGGVPGAGGGSECGDGKLEGDEQCDDGNVNSGDGCSADCQIETTAPGCGDDIVGPGEECDDGNLRPGDGCDAQCRIERCGNGRVDAGEECDPPAAGTCSQSCNIVRQNCGDGIVQTSDGEQCDDGNDQAGDGCFECRFECGDGRIDASIGEQCEPDPSEMPPRCSSTCKWLPACGDGIVQPEIGEQCDPSNGVTCVACKTVTPTTCGDGEGGCGGGTNECVPDASSDAVLNGGFVSDTTGWSASGPSVTLGSVDDGYPAPKALALSFASVPVRSEQGAYQCVPVSGARNYTFQADYFIPNDAADGVGVAVIALLYPGPSCSGSYVGSPISGQQGLVRGAWTPYSFHVDTSALSAGSSPARLLIRLDVVQPANVQGTRVYWDSVTLAEPGARCGDCHIDPGETCDDGNRIAGDGCSASCQIERCGDGTREPSEQCDDGNTTFGGSDTCSPACRSATACDTCSGAQCLATFDACFGLTGEAQAGPRAGTARSTLCDALLSCVRRTDCDLATRTTVSGSGAYLENCYCGTSGADCFDGKVKPNGSCRAETEAALESTASSEIVGRFDGSNPAYPIFGAVRDLLKCEDTSCSTDCARAPSCGDGRIEDRNLNFNFTINGQSVPCDDSLTATGHGCSVEECDDGNTTPGDGCDEHCFLEVCGNNVVQAGEDCDDGNRVSGDGCSADCHGEFQCGDGVVTHPFEDCEPPQKDGADCTLAQSQTDPSSCACDAHCKYAVCGDGVLQKPYEDCDPPDGINCGTDCKVVGQTACEACLANYPTTSNLQDTYCSEDANCIAVERCVINAKCFSPNPPIFCYCGFTDPTTHTVDAGVCSTASYSPTGPCADVIKAGAPGKTNDDIVLDYFGFDTSSGVAFYILQNAFSKDPDCKSVCF